MQYGYIMIYHHSQNPILSHLYGPAMVDNLAPKVSSLGFASRSLEPLQMRSSFRASPGRFSEIWRFPQAYSYGMLWWIYLIQYGLYLFIYVIYIYVCV